MAADWGPPCACVCARAWDLQGRVLWDDSHMVPWMCQGSYDNAERISYKTSWRNEFKDLLLCCAVIHYIKYCRIGVFKWKLFTSVLTAAEKARKICSEY